MKTGLQGSGRVLAGQGYSNGFEQTTFSRAVVAGKNRPSGMTTIRPGKIELQVGKTSNIFELYLVDVHEAFRLNFRFDTWSRLPLKRFPIERFERLARKHGVVRADDDPAALVERVGLASRRNWL